MPKVEELCEVSVEGGIYRDWLAVAIEQSFSNESWIRRFRLQVAEPSTKNTLRLAPRFGVDIKLAGVPAIVGGLISDRQVAYDGSRHAVQVDGCSKAYFAERASANVAGGQFRGYKLDAIGNAVLKPYGMKFRVENGPDGWDLPFPNVAIHHGETCKELLGRLCRMRGLRIRSEADGTLVAGTKVEHSGVRLAEGTNILQANCHIALPGVETMTMRSQTPGSDSIFGRKAAEISASAKIPGGPPGSQAIYLGEMPLSQREAQIAVDAIAADMQASTISVSITHQGWLRPGVGGLWTLSEPVTVQSAMMFPGASDEMKMRVWNIEWTQDSTSGSLTKLTLVNDAAFGQRSPDATKEDPFWNVPIDPGRPDAET